MMLRIEVELDEKEVTYLTQSCVGRVANSAINAVPEDYEHIMDLFELRDVMEPLRAKLQMAIFLAKVRERGQPRFWDLGSFWRG